MAGYHLSKQGVPYSCGCKGPCRKKKYPSRAAALGLPEGAQRTVTSLRKPGSKRGPLRAVPEPLRKGPSSRGLPSSRGASSGLALHLASSALGRENARRGARGPQGGSAPRGEDLRRSLASSSFGRALGVSAASQRQPLSGEFRTPRYRRAVEAVAEATTVEAMAAVGRARVASLPPVKRARSWGARVASWWRAL